MKVAWITPVSMLSLYADRSDYHLMLPCPMNNHKDYFSFYRHQARGYKIMDNGAAEGELVSPATLMSLARMVRADEVVVPDVIGDAGASWKFIKKFESVVARNPWFKYMAVAQGLTFEEFQTYVLELADLEWVTTIALPRHLCTTIGPNARIQLAQWMNEVGITKSKELHCLGTSASYIMEAAEIAQLDYVRGIDTSMPIYCGLWGFDIRRDNVANAKRPDNYWEYEFVGGGDQELVERNLETFLEWTHPGGTASGGDDRQGAEPSGSVD